MNGTTKWLRDRQWDYIKVFLAALVPALIGFLDLLLLWIYEFIIYIHAGKALDPKSIYAYAIQPTLYNIGIILIVLGIGSLFLEVYGYTSFFKKRIAELFTQYEMVNIFSDMYAIELRKNLLKKIYNPTCEDSNQLLSLFDEKLSNILGGNYYEKFEVTIRSRTFKLGNKWYIEKKIRKRMRLSAINKNTKNTVSIIQTVSCQKSQSHLITNFVINQLVLDGKLTKEKVDYKVKTIIEKNKKPYNVTYQLEFIKPLSTEKTRTIIIEYTTIVPYKDRNYSFRIDLLCKSLEIDFYVNEKNTTVNVSGFKFSSFKDQFETSCEGNIAMAKSNGWLLPGEGVSFSLMNTDGRNT